MADVFITGITDVDNMVVSPGSFDVVSGTGNFTPFLRVDDSDGTSEGFNTDDSGKVLDNGASWTQSLKLSEVPIVIRNGIAYYEIRLDLNEPNNGTDGLGRPASQVGLSEFQVYFSDRGATLGDYTGSSTTALGSAFTKVYDLDSGTDRTLVLSDGASGSGRDDYVFYIPVANFSAAEADDYFTLYAKFGPSPEENATFEEFRIRSDTGTITGTKFADINGDGIKQANEGTLSGFKFYIDVNGNDQFDVGEIYAISGANGSFTFQSLTAGTYTIREDMTAEQKALYTSITGAQSGGEITVTVTASGTTTIFWGNQPKIADFSLTKTVTSIDGGTKVGANWVADSAGDVVNYDIVITNTGNIALTGKSILDANGVLGAISGDTNSNGVLDVGETWTVTATHAVSQAELDSKGTSDTGALDSDGDTDNKVVVDFAETEAKSASAVSLLTYNPNFTVVKAVTSITGGTKVGSDYFADSAGDVVNYDIVITNTGNITLTGKSILDANGVIGAISGDTDGDGNLDVGEAWTIKATHAVSQAELDSKGTSNTSALDSDGDTDNLVSVKFAETGTKTGEAVSYLVYNPDFSVAKSVASITGGVTIGGITYADSDGDKVNYSIVVKNTGNISLTGFSYTDANADAGTITLASGDTDGDGVLDVGETWTYSAVHTVSQAELDAKGTGSDGKIDGDGDTDNLVTVSFNEAGPKSDDASSPLVYNPDFSVVKSVASITGGVTIGGITYADSDGDKVNYSIVVKNTGNISLTGFSYTDANADAGTITLASGDTDGDGVLDVGETWTYSAVHTVSQAELDAKGTGSDGKIDGDGDTDNLVTVSFNEAGPKSDDASSPLVYNPDFSVVKSVASITGGVTIGGITYADSDGDKVNYSIVVKNTGNISLTGFSYTDANADAGTITLASGDTDSDGVLDVGETWTYSAVHTVSQAELDAKGTGSDGKIDGDGDTDNLVTVSFNEAGPKSDDASSPLVYNPDFGVAKSVASITGGTYDAGTKLWTADSAGDKVNYTIAVQNLGNITLTGFTYSDPNADGGTITYVSGDTDGDKALDVGETWTFSAVHTVTQGELNSKGTNDAGALDTDGDTDNKVTVDFVETSEKSAATVSLLTYAPAIDLVKYVSVTGKDGSYVDANTAALGPQNVNIGAPVFFQVTVENKGNIDLTNVKITDLNTSNGGNVSVTLFENKTLLAGAILAGDTDSDGILDVGEKWTITYSQPFDSGQHVNTATVTTAENVTDSDAAYYYSIVNTGPGVRTPGFWGSPNGLEFWDGVANNESKGGMTGFAKGELTYLVDSNNDGVLDSKGLLLGDLDKDGITDLGENTFYVSLSDAKALINASSKLENSDGAVKIGRDAVATWLNYLAGNSLGTDSDAKSPLTYLNDGIDFLQAWAGKAGPVGGGGEVFDAWDSNHKAVKTTSSAWTGAGEGGNYSGDAIHNALDYYNNNGQTSYGGFKYADDGDDGGFLKALAASQSTLHII